MEYSSQEISVRVITCSDHSSAAWKQMMWCSEIRVFSHCIRHSFLGGWPGGPLCIGRHLLFRLCLTTSVSVLGMHLLQTNPASVELQAYRSPLASIQPPTCYSHGLLIAGICVWALLPNHCWSGQTPACREHLSISSSYFYLPQPWTAAGSPRKDATAWEHKSKYTSLPALAVGFHVKTSHSKQHLGSSFPISSMCSSSHSQQCQFNSIVCYLPVHHSSFMLIWGWHLEMKLLKDANPPCQAPLQTTFRGRVWHKQCEDLQALAEKVSCTGIAKPVYLWTQKARTMATDCKINGQDGHGLRPLGWVNCNICWHCLPLNWGL